MEQRLKQGYHQIFRRNSSRYKSTPSNCSGRGSLEFEKLVCVAELKVKLHQAGRIIRGKLSLDYCEEETTTQTKLPRAKLMVSGRGERNGHYLSERGSQLKVLIAFTCAKSLDKHCVKRLSIRSSSDFGP